MVPKFLVSQQLLSIVKSKATLWIDACTLTRHTTNRSVCEMSPCKYRSL